MIDPIEVVVILKFVLRNEGLKAQIFKQGLGLRSYFYSFFQFVRNFIKKWRGRWTASLV